MKVVGIDHVQLAIPPGGEAAARRFYGEVLGMTEVPKPEPMRARGGLWWFRCRGSTSRLRLRRSRRGAAGQLHTRWGNAPSALPQGFDAGNASRVAVPL